MSNITSGFPNLGVALSLAGTAILNTYVAGPAFYTGAIARVRFYGKLVGSSGTPISPVYLKIQAYDDVNAAWYDVESNDDTDSIANAPIIEHGPITVSSATTVATSLTVDGSYPQLRIAARAAATGQAGDAIAIEARAVGFGLG